MASLAAPAQGQSACSTDNVGCSTSEIEFHHRDALFEGVMLDSGWVPSSGPIQVRFAVLLGGSTEVDMAGVAETWWPSALSAAVRGHADGGRLAIDYGLELIARARVDVQVGGIRYREEFDIPLPGRLPRDLRLAAETLFDPFALPPSEPIGVQDDTERVHVVELDITETLLPIPGVGGGFALDAAAMLTSSYRTDRIAITDALTDIVEEGASVIVRADPGAPGLGAAKDYKVLPHGTITYDGVITLYPTLFIEIPGRRFDLTIGEIPLRVVDLSAPTDFQPAEVHVPLPDVRLAASSLAFGAVAVGAGFERLLTIHNDGEAELRVRADVPEGPFAPSPATLVIPPRSSTAMSIRFEPMLAGEANAVLWLETNDPDEPRLAVRLSGEGELAFGDAGLGDAGVPDAGLGDGGLDPIVTTGGCGCRTAGGGSTSPWTGVLFLPLLLVLAARRKRRAA